MLDALGWLTVKAVKLVAYTGGVTITCDNKAARAAEALG